MVEEQLVRRGIRDARVLAAMSELAREAFLPVALAPVAYDDRALPVVDVRNDVAAEEKDRIVRAEVHVRRIACERCRSEHGRNCAPFRLRRAPVDRQVGRIPATVRKLRD